MTERGVPVEARLVDPDRLAAVAATGLLDTPAEAVFDDLARIAARLLGMPLAFVTVVDGRRSYWKATVGTGIAPDDVDTRQNTVQESFCQYLITTDGPIVVPDATADDLVRANPSVESMGVRAWAGFPVRSPDGHVLGSFCVVDTSPRAFTEDDLEVLSTLSLAASREVALRQTVHRAEALAEQAEQANRRLRTQALASDLLGASLRGADVLTALSGLAVPELGDWLVVALRGDVAGPTFGTGSADPARVVVVEVAHADPRARSRLRELLRVLPLSIADGHGVGRVIATGEPEYVHQAQVAGLRLARAAEQDVRAIPAELADRPVLTVPLASRGRVLGAMTVGARRGGDLDRELIVDLGRRAAIALDNAITYGDEHLAGLELQRSLMPSRPPVVPGLAIASRYLPATVGALAGGDFHQVVRRPRDVVLVLGDVEGHGMTSAARMGQLRAAVATLALEGHQPGLLLERLTAGARDVLGLSLATLLVAAFDPATRVLTLASAGHPPALVAEPGAPPYLSTLRPGPPIGVGAVRIPESRQVLPAGSVVALYSDGLIERRGEDIDIGLERLRRALEAAVTGTDDVESIADALVDGAGCAAGGTDDIALLVFR